LQQLDRLAANCCAKRRNGLRIFLFESYETPLRSSRCHSRPHPGDYRARAAFHDDPVCAEQRLAFQPVCDHDVCFAVELDMRRETRPAGADDPSVLDFLQDLISRQLVPQNAD
jgi:hypothetical protein